MEDVQFGLYRLAGPQGPLWKGNTVVELAPKELAVLWELVTHAGQVVSKDALFTAVWGETIVSDGALSVSLRRLRQALEEDATQPRYIATVHRIGYRFIAAVAAVQSSKFNVQSSLPLASTPTTEVPRSFQRETLNLKLETTLVGRDPELTQLHSLFVKALGGERQLVFVTGEAGIGKTALVDTFVQGLASSVSQRPESRVKTDPKSEPTPSPHPITPGWWVGAGQCIEHYGTGEAYLPVLEALGRLCRHADGEAILSVLRRVAPSWLLQLPALISEAERATLQQRVAGVTRERMLREMVEALETLSAVRPLVLVLEDVHWSDASTIDLLNLFVRRREPARLLVLATNRQAELVVSNHPLKTLKQELVLRGYGTELLLGGLSVAAVQQYVRQRFVTREAETELGTVVYRRTEGHPLFMVQLSDYLAQREELVAMAAPDAGVDIPQQLRQLIEVQVARLTADEQRVLEVGSVAGVEFPLASVAAALEKPMDEIETVCEQLSQRGHFLVEREVSRWPDGTVSGCYGFRHALYQEVLYQRLSASRRIRAHQRIGAREAAGYGDAAVERAAELAMHFERGQQPQQAITYLHCAAGVMVQRQAYQEAITSLHRALELLQSFPDSLSRASQELPLQVFLGVAFMTRSGYAAPEAEAAYARARELCQRLGDSPQIVPALVRLLSFYTFRGELPLGAQVADQILQLLQHQDDPEALLEAHLYKGIIEYLLGNWEAGRYHCEAVLPLYDSKTHHLHALHYGYDPGVIARSLLSSLLWQLGYPAQALQQSQQALTFAALRGHTPSWAIALWFAVLLRVYRQEWAEVHQLATELQALVASQGLVQWVGFGMYAQGWARAAVYHEESALALMAQGLAAYRSIGADLGTYGMQAWLAEQYGLAGHFAEAERLLSETLVLIEHTQEVAWSGEFSRLKGELLLQKFPVSSSEFQVEKRETRNQKRGTRSPQASSHKPLTMEVVEEAAGYFLKAIEIARAHRAKSFELRAVMSLVRLQQQQVRDLTTRYTQTDSRATQHAAQTALAEAHTMLSEVYGWFTEGFDTKDLQEARALLKTMSD